MKKILFVLFLVLSFSLVGCDFFSNNTNESNGDDISGEYKNVVLSNGIGRSVNVIENKYIETYAGAKPVFDSSILSDFRLVRTPLQTQTAVSFSSDSAEGFIEQQQLKVDGKLSASAGLKKIFTASVSQAFTYESSYTFTQNTREMFYTVQQNIVGDRVEIEGYRDASIFEDALNSGFITDIEKVKTGDLTASEFINLYGTHVIVSGYFGGKINCYFYLKTEDTSLGETSRVALQTKIKAGITKVVSGEASVSIDSEIGSVVNSSLSTYSFTAEGIGGSIQSFGNFSQFASNYSAWATSFNEDDSYSVLVDVPDQGLLAIWDLLPDEYSTERTALINAFNAMADSQYSEFLGLFMKNVDYGDYVNFAGGTGTPSDPYKIATVDHLRNIDKFLDDGTHFVLISDIDTTAKYSNWDPIGTNESSSESLTSNIFKGNFNGNGHTIKYQINSIDSSNSENLYQFVGLFGYTKDASIDNLTVDATINVSDLLAYTIFAGGISGKSVSSDFSDCSNVGDIYLKNTTVFGFSGNIYAGGITGSMIHGNYTNCINEANIYASSGIAASGGIVSSQSDTSFSNCSNSATLFAQIVLRDRVMPGPTGDLYAFDLNDIG